MKAQITPILLFALCSSLVVSCSSTGPQANARADQARIYVLRRLSPVKAVGPIDIFDNGKPMGSIRQGGVVEWSRPAGKVTISASASNEAKIDLVVEPNETYYIDVRALHVSGTHLRNVQIRVLSKREGARLLGLLRKKQDPLRQLQGR